MTVSLILILYIARHDFRYKCDGRGGRARELDGALGGNPSFEVLERGGLHLVDTGVVPVGGGADKEKRVLVLFGI